MSSRGMASIADQAAAAAINFAVSIFIGRHLGVDALGLFAITNVFVLLVRALQNSIVLEPMAVFGPRRSAEEYPRYFGFLAGLEGVSVLIFSILFAAGSAAAYALDLIARDLFHVMLASCVYVNFLSFQFFLRRQFYVDHRQYFASIQSMSYLLLVIAGLGALWRVEGLSVVDIYTLLSACSLLVCVVQGGRFWSTMAKTTPTEMWSYWRDHWSFGKWILLSVPFGILTYQGFFAIVGFFISHEAAGLLKAAEVFIAPFAQIVIGMQLMLVPMASRNADNMSVPAQKRLAFRTGAAFIAVSAAYSALVYFGGQFFLVLLFGEKMREAVPLLWILAFIPLFRGLPMAAGVILTSRKQANLRFFSQSSSTLLTLIVCVPLIYYGGLTGAAIGMVVSQALYAATNWGCLFWLWRQDRLRVAATA